MAVANNAEMRICMYPDQKSDTAQRDLARIAQALTVLFGAQPVNGQNPYLLNLGPDHQIQVGLRPTISGDRFIPFASIQTRLNDALTI